MSSLCDTTLDFVFRQGSVEIEEIGLPFQKDLERLNITVRTLAVDAEEFSEREKNGDYNIIFTKTWGSPYDPHSYLSSWAVPSHVEYSSTQGLEPPVTQSDILELISEVLVEQDSSKRDEQYANILQGVHEQAAFVPLYGVRTPYVISNRLSGFTAGAQTYSYPIATVNADTGPTRVTVAAGSGGAPFTTVGRIHPHFYSPNQLFAQDWIYERLVKYGDNGQIEPSLATAWTIEEDGGGWKATFTLRKNVKFHNGEPWNCAAAKLNFDHVLHPTVKGRHSWFMATELISEWSCEGDDNEDFIIKTSEPYYPLLQELSYIRPLAFAAPGAYADGVESDPEKQNSCHPGDFGTGYEDIAEEITCAGLTGPIGTGPFRYVSRDTGEVDGSEVDTVVRFQRFEDYWGTVGNIEELDLVYYDDTDTVRDDLLSGDLDMALGLGPLEEEEITELREDHSDKVTVYSSSVQQHAVAVLNTNKAPTDNVHFRRSIIYGIDKGEDIVRDAFADVRVNAAQLMPKTQPHCNVELDPEFTYNIAEARAQCQSETLIGDSAASTSSGLSTGGIVGIVAAVGVVFIVLVGLVFVRRKKSSAVSPPLENMEEQKSPY